MGKSTDGSHRQPYVAKYMKSRNADSRGIIAVHDLRFLDLDDLRGRRHAVRDEPLDAAFSETDSRGVKPASGFVGTNDRMQWARAIPPAGVATKFSLRTAHASLGTHVVAVLHARYGSPAD